MSSKGPSGRIDLPRIFLVAVGLLFAWLLAWIWLSWPYSLDDALIHLRYADNLLHRHMLSCDGVHPSFGTSSLLYVSVLAALHALWASPLLPRVLSSVVYVGLFLLLAVVLFRAGQDRGEQPLAVWLLAIAFLAVMVAPSAIRWLDDGMETGLVFLDATIGVLVLRALVHSARLPRSLLGLAFLYGALTVLLRVELLVLPACISLMAGLEMYTGRVRRFAVEHPVRGLLAASTPLLGSLAGACLILLTMHVLLPDTALAKAYGLGEWRSTFQMTADTLASSCSFGIGLLLLWLASLLTLLVWRGPRLTDVPANLLFPLVLLAAAARGQQIQGIRYFGWTFFFPLLWNLLRITDDEPKPSPTFGLLASIPVALLLVALVPAFAWESRTFQRLFQGRGASLHEFLAQPQLATLQGQLGLAEDVGFVGYFTKGNICDPYGLVNGRAAARLDYQKRFDRCLASHPVFAFGSNALLEKMTHKQSLEGWYVCGSYPFNNVRSQDLHYLVVTPGLAQRACPGDATPIKDVLPGLV